MSGLRSQSQPVAELSVGHSRAAIPRGARLDPSAQAGSDPGVETHPQPPVPPGHPTLQPQGTSCSSPHGPGSLQPPGLCTCCSFFLESHFPFLFLVQPVPIPQLSAQTVEAASSKKLSLLLPHEARVTG